METLSNKLNLVKALLAFQAEIPIICKNEEGYGYKYSDLAEIIRTIQPFMSKNGLGITQNVEIKDSLVFVTTTLFHSSGEYIESTLSGDVNLNVNKMNNIQTIGSIVTYLRRYGISAILNLVTDIDNDGNLPKAEDKKPTTTTQPGKAIPKKDVFVIDKNKYARYNKTKELLFDEYQKKNGLIETPKWLEIKVLIQKKLVGNVSQFTKWLKGNYGVDFYDIKIEMVAGIIKTLNENPNYILDFGLDK